MVWTDGSGITSKLCEFALACRWEDIPDTVRREAVRSLVNGFGTALGGAGDAGVRSLTAAMLKFSAASTTSLIGRPERTDMLTASFLNGAAVNVFDFDDTHEGTILHPTAPILPVVFALAEQAPVSGQDLLAAFVVGVEIECRLANALSPGHYRKGWHITSTCGVFGAALAAGRLLCLNGAQMHAALGIASAQSSGLVETLGSMAKSVGVGASARGGLLAALLAQDGLEGPRQPLEGPRGFLAVMSDGVDAAAATQGLGSEWELLRNMYKPYPCGVVLNPVIDACLDLRGEHGFDAARIARIEVRGNPLLKERTDRPEASNGRESQVSAQHAIAVALARGSCGVRDFGDEAVADPAVRAVRSRIAAVTADPSLSVDSIVLRVELAGGEIAEKRVDVPRGSLGRPLSDGEIETKFRALAAFGAPDLDCERLLPALWSIGESADAAGVLALAR